MNHTVIYKNRKIMTTSDWSSVVKYGTIVYATIRIEEMVWNGVYYEGCCITIHKPNSDEHLDGPTMWTSIEDFYNYWKLPARRVLIEKTGHYL